MTDFVKLIKAADVADPGRETLELADRVVVLLHVDGKFYCIDDVCTHDGGTLGDGKLEDHLLACPRHGAKFDIRDGRAVTFPATSPTTSHEVKVEAGEVYVRINDQ